MQATRIAITLAFLLTLTPARAGDFWTNLRPSSQVGQQKFVNALTAWHRAQQLGAGPLNVASVRLHVLGELDGAITLDPDSPLFLTCYAQTILAVDSAQLDRAEEYATRALAICPDFVPGRLILAEVALRHGTPDVADKQCAEAFKALSNLKYGYEKCQGPLKAPVKLLGILPITGGDKETGPISRTQRAELLLAMHHVDNCWSILSGALFDPSHGPLTSAEAASVFNRLQARIQEVHIRALIAQHAPDDLIDHAFDDFRNYDKNYIPATITQAQYLVSRQQFHHATELIEPLVAPSAPNIVLSTHPTLLVYAARLHIYGVRMDRTLDDATVDQWVNSARRELQALAAIPPMKPIADFEMARLYLITALVAGDPAIRSQLLEQGLTRVRAIHETGNDGLVDSQVKEIDVLVSEATNAK